MTLSTIPMYDAINAANVPPGGQVYAGYVNGKTQWQSHGPLMTRFPNARVFGIDVLGNDPEGASILDYEPGDVQNPASAAAWCNARNAFRPFTATVYCDRAELSALEMALKGVWHYLWIATLDGTDLTGQHHPTNGTLVVATQVWDRGPYDQSSILPFWAGL